ncbi:hypothetical protein B0H13DRAFT_1866887 [Mycena leptocephala]|nr:hypothetical protein B0H13DRAFT_1866887 [Mycena leptocephala]
MIYESTPEPNSAGRNIPEQDSDASEDEDDDILLVMECLPNAARSMAGRTVTILVLLYFRYRYAIVFPTFIGSSSSPAMHTKTFHHTTPGLRSLVRKRTMFPPIDNVNKMQRAWQQVLGRRDTLTSGTAATLSWLIMICGDQLSMTVFANQGLHGQRRYSIRSHDWALPVIHYGISNGMAKGNISPPLVRANGQDIFGLLTMYICSLATSLSVNKTGIVHPPKTPLIDSLEMYFNAKSDGPLSDIDSTNWTHFLTQWGFSSRSEVHGPQRPNCCPVSDPQASVEEESDVRAIAEEISGVFSSYQGSCDSLLGAGATTTAMKCGDGCNFLYEFPPALQDAVLNNYLVNTTGLLGTGLSWTCFKNISILDKRLFILKAIALIPTSLGISRSDIHGFSAVRDQFPRLFGLRRTTGPTKRPNHKRLECLGVHYRDDKLWSTFPLHGHVVPNE